MVSPCASHTLGVVVAHQPDRPIAETPAVRDLLPQVDQLLVVCNGSHTDASTSGDATPGPIRWIAFETNRGTAAAWNAALAVARKSGYRYLYLLDQDSTPSPDAVAQALSRIAFGGAAAVVQPALQDRLRLDPFPWNTVASGSLLDVEVLEGLGGFDERLFVDEVDHEIFDRMVRSGYKVMPLANATIGHQTGSPRQIRFMGRSAVVSGHSVERRRLQGFSAGLLARRYIRAAPATSVRLLLRQALTAAKDLSAGERDSARSVLAGLLTGATTGQSPTQAAERGCPYCGGPLLGRFADVPDWLFGTGSHTDVYWCSDCGALVAGRVPGSQEIASWYDDYYTHTVEPARTRVWSGLWPTPGRRRELDRLRRYLSPLGEVGRFLEVGTGSGERLDQFAEAGWEVVGQDLDPKAGYLARHRGIKVHECPVGELVGREQPFDLIGLNHVLEHVAEPRALLEACAALLAPGGRICIISPNAEGLGRLLFGRWWFGLDQPRHLAIPTLKSLEQVTAPLGLRPTCAETVSTNAAVMLGGSLSRGFQQHLPPGHLRRATGFSMNFLGQAMGRSAIALHHRLGEEVVWVGHRTEP